MQRGQACCDAGGRVATGCAASRCCGVVVVVARAARPSSWHGCGKGRAHSWCRCVRGAPGPGTDVGGGEPSQSRCRCGRGEPSQSRRRCGRGEPSQSRSRCGQGEPSQSRRRCGRGSAPVLSQRWSGGRPVPAQAWAGSAPVLTQMWQRQPLVPAQMWLWVLCRLLRACVGLTDRIDVHTLARHWMCLCACGSVRDTCARAGRSWR